MHTSNGIGVRAPSLSCQTGQVDDTITPRELARELGVSTKAIRDFLRAEYGLLAERQLTRWELKGEEAARVRAHFRAKH